MSESNDKFIEWIESEPELKKRAEDERVFIYAAWKAWEACWKHKEAELERMVKKLEEMGCE